MTQPPSLNDHAVLLLPEPVRGLRINEQRFYYEQGKQRLLTQFENIEAEAEEYAQHWLDAHAHRFNPDRDDPSALPEQAYDESVSFYQMLADMRMQTRLGLIAGMYHQWEKHLREWLVNELMHVWLHDKVKPVIWNANAPALNELMACLHIQDCDAAHMKTLDACRLVVNVYKHGEGSACDKLQRDFPEYMPSPFSSPHYDAIDWPVDHSQLAVNDEQFRNFSEAIVSFWRAVPAQVLDSEVTELPSWFEKGLCK